MPATNKAVGDQIHRFLRRREVVRLTGLPVSTLYERMAAGEFPRPVRISPRLVAWLESDIIQWQANRISERSDVYSPAPSENVAR